MNLISDLEAHERDEAFDREDAKHRRHPTVTHADKVAFADAMMADTKEHEELCDMFQDPEEDICTCKNVVESEEEHHE